MFKFELHGAVEENCAPLPVVVATLWEGGATLVERTARIRSGSFVRQMRSQSFTTAFTLLASKVINLPLNGRDVWPLGLPANNAVPVKGVSSNLPFIAGGGRFQTNNIILDGIDNNTIATAIQSDY